MGFSNSKEDSNENRVLDDAEKRKENNRIVINVGFEIALDKLRKTLQYDQLSTVEAASDEISDELSGELKNKLILEIYSLYFQSFTAAGNLLN